MLLFIQTITSFVKNEEYRNLLFTSFMVIVVGTIAFHYIEGWSWVDSLYFSVITLTTVGYGDFSPATDAGKLFTIFYIIIGLGMILNFINTVYNHYAQMKTNQKGKQGNRPSERNPEEEEILGGDGVGEDNHG